MLNQNLIWSPYDSRDYKFAARVPPQPSTNLTRFNVLVDDQGTQGTCGSNGYNNYLELITQRAGQYERTARQFTNHITQKASGLLGQEGVWSARDVLEASRRWGSCLESEWSYGLQHKDVEPPLEVYDSAATRKLVRYEAVDISKSRLYGSDPQLGIDNINSALAEGLPVLIAFAVGQKFVTLHGPLKDQHYGVVDIGGVDTGNAFLGGHIILLEGNDDNMGDAGGWIAEGSYGTTGPGSGDNGYVNIPYPVIRDFSEAWIIRGYKNLSFTDPDLYEKQMQMVKMYVGGAWPSAGAGRLQVLDGRPPEQSGYPWRYRSRYDARR